MIYFSLRRSKQAVNKLFKEENHTEGTVLGSLRPVLGVGGTADSQKNSGVKTIRKTQ